MDGRYKAITVGRCLLIYLQPGAVVVALPLHAFTTDRAYKLPNNSAAV